MSLKARSIALVPIGMVDAGALEHVSRALGEVLALPTAVRSMLPIPPGSYDPERRQYYSPVFLCFAQTARQSQDEIVLGITEVDLFVRELNFVFGQASAADRVAVISLCRFGTGREPVSLDRAVKEAVHEVGHVLGLPHCRDPHCVMFFSNSLADTDRKAARFCSRCAGQIRER